MTFVKNFLVFFFEGFPNSGHRPGGGQVKIENRKLDWNVEARTVNLNTKYSPGGGDRKVRLLKRGGA